MSLAQAEGTAELGGVWSTVKVHKQQHQLLQRCKLSRNNSHFSRDYKSPELRSHTQTFFCFLLLPSHAGLVQMWRNLSQCWWHSPLKLPGPYRGCCHSRDTGTHLHLLPVPKHQQIQVLWAGTGGDPAGLVPFVLQ